MLVTKSLGGALVLSVNSQIGDVVLDYEKFRGICGENIGGNRAIIVTDNKFYYASQSNLNHVNKVIGITTQSGIINSSIIVQSSGEMIEPSWNWDIDKPVYLGNNGLLTQTIPSTGFLLEMGIPNSNISLIIRIKIPIILY